MLNQCPVCGHGLVITKLHCDSCNTTIEGRFQNCKLCTLSEEEQEFIEIFLVCRGSIKEVEKMLGISYPTVRGKLEALIEKLGYRKDKPEKKKEDSSAVSDEKSRRRNILKSFELGDINADEALNRIIDLD